MLAHDVETAGRCALATLANLSRDVQSLALSESETRRLCARIAAASRHVGEILAEDQPRQRRAYQSAPAVDAPAPAAGELEAEAKAVWAAGAVLRTPPDATAAAAARGELRRLAAYSPHERVRKLATRVLGADAS